MNANKRELKNKESSSVISVHSRAFADNNYNPDVLSCIANLSSDEVFTPPQLVNRMLDLLPPEIWSDPKATFLDPGCKSGVFLREIAKRLDKGLEDQIPDRQRRMNHIFKNQLFGLSITELTALLSRRSIYCSKTANGKYSVCETFDTPEGNIRFERIEHAWEKGRCVYCGANEENYFMVGLLKNTQDTTKDRFAFVPQLPMMKSWTDEKLYKRYGLTEDEIAFIESKIRPMPAFAVERFPRH